MSEPILREEIKRNLHIYRGWTHDSDAAEDIEHRTDEIEQLIHAEVLAVLERLEKEKQMLWTDMINNDTSVRVWGVPLSAITQLKQRYGGKETI